MTSVVWLNGRLLASDAARIDPADRGFTLGDGLFETIRVEHGEPLFWGRHFARLFYGANILGIQMPFPEPMLLDAMRELLQASGLVAAALRITLSRGPAPRGVLPIGDARPTLLMSAGPLPSVLPPARVIIAQSVRRNEFSTLSRIKSLNYLDSTLARREAASAGADDAMLLNTRGDLAEGSAANALLYLDGRWITPRVVDGALPGIARGLLLESGKVTEVRVLPDYIRYAEAGALVNSLGMRALACIGNATLNPEHRALQALHAD